MRLKVHEKQQVGHLSTSGALLPSQTLVAFRENMRTFAGLCSTHHRPFLASRNGLRRAQRVAQLEVELEGSRRELAQARGAAFL
jgi:hypothetical protein